MNEDMMDMVKKMSEMMGNKEIPESIKNVLNSMNMNNLNNSSNSNGSDNNINNFSDSENNESKVNKGNNKNEDTIRKGENLDNNINLNNFMGDIDFNTIMKIQKIMSSLKNDKQNDYRSNLLLALKPYVRDSRKSKVDMCIQFMKMGKIIEVMNPTGGDK